MVHLLHSLLMDLHRVNTLFHQVLIALFPEASHQVQGMAQG